MAKLPYFQFFPADWLADTRPLSLATKGAWIDTLCILHSAQNRGERTMPVLGWARSIGATVDQTEAVIVELEQMGIADVTRCSNADVTLRSRRMSRDALTCEQTRRRVQAFREKRRGDGSAVADDETEVVTPAVTEVKRGCNDDVTPKKSEGIRQIEREAAREGAGVQGGEAAPAVPSAVGREAGRLPAGWTGEDAAAAWARWCEYLAELGGWKPIPLSTMDAQRKRAAEILKSHGQADAIEAVNWSMEARLRVLAVKAVNKRDGRAREPKKTVGKKDWGWGQ